MFTRSGVIIFWTAAALLILLSGTFIYQSYQKLAEVQKTIKEGGETNADRFAFETLDSLKDVPLNEKALRAYVILESDAMRIRHSRSTAALTTRMWLEFMCLKFGTILVTVGAAFVLAKVSTPTPTNAEVKFGEMGGSIASALGCPP